MTIAASIARRLLEINAIKLSPKTPFTWVSGLKSPIYCDNRIALSYPSVRKEIISGLKLLAEDKFSFDGIAGVATAGIPHGAILSEQLNCPFIYVRSKAKKHGRQNKIEGDSSQITKVLVVEDLISTGGSSIDAVDSLIAANIKVSGVIAIFTYGFPISSKTFSRKHIELNTLTDYPTLLEEAKNNDYINKEEYEQLKNWSLDPKKWSYQNQ